MTKTYEFRSKTINTFHLTRCESCEVSGRKIYRNCDNCKKPFTQTGKVRIKPLTERQKQYLNKVPRLTRKLIAKTENIICPFAKAANDLNHSYCRITEETAHVNFAKHCLSSNYALCPNFNSPKALPIYRHLFKSIFAKDLTDAQDIEHDIRLKRLGIDYNLLSALELKLLFNE